MRNIKTICFALCLSLCASLSLAATISLPASSSVCPGEDVVVPITLDPATGVLAMDFSIEYDPAVVTPVAVHKTELTAAFSLFHNVPTPGQLRIAMFATSALTGSGQVAYIIFNAAGGTGSSSSLVWNQFDLNEGNIPAAALGGSVSVVSGTTTLSMPDDANGAPATIVQAPIIADPSDGYLGLDLVVRWNPAVLQATSVTTAPGMPGDWTVTANLGTPGTALISMFGTTILSGTRPVAHIHYLVVGAVGEQTPLDIAVGTVNEGEISSCLDDGLFSVCADLDGDGYTDCGGDCNDNDPGVNPGASEICDAIDQNCDGSLNDGGADASCDDDNACTVDSCTAGGTCAYAPRPLGTPCGSASDTDCDNPDSCDANGVCQPNHETNGTACDDGSACTQTDTCQGGLCTGGSPVVCTPLDQCHVAGTCDPGTGVCSDPPAPNGTVCDDENACTQTDTCQAGACTGSNPVVCPAGQCEDPGTCDPETGDCSPALPKPDGTPCDDGEGCTTDDQCSGGVCVGGAPLDCDDDNECTVDTCNPGGNCVNTPVDQGTACDDGDPCTINDACTGPLCVGAAITAPPEVQELQVAADKVTFSWSSALFATTYDVVRGEVAALPVGPGGGDETCFGGLGSTDLVDAAIPGADEAAWYLVRGRNSCGSGSYGATSGGAPRTTTTCP